MPAKQRSAYVCNSCGAVAPKWMGRCPACEAWNTLQETAAATASSLAGQPVLSSPASISDMEAEETERKLVGIAELDRVLGGGLVAGSLVLLGGEPGVGKSTLLLQAAHQYAQRWGTVLYISAEESARQVKMRARRLGALSEQLLVWNETDLAAILSQVISINPGLVVIDSIQTITHADVGSTAGSIAQVTACAQELLRIAKQTGIVFVLVGHVNKAGSLAGPKVLEHTVDVVLEFGGEKHTPYRLLRAVKNRYGSTHELGVFLMEGNGLTQVPNPSASFLAERPAGMPGSAVVACMQGMRPLLLEVQALVSPAPFGGTPRRQTAGVDRNRAAIVLAVLEKRAGLQLATYDVFINVAGGLAVDEPAADLGIAMAVASSYRGLAVGAQTVVFGEIGLAGELRSVSHAQRRLNEAATLGFTTCIMPRHRGKLSHGSMLVTAVGHLGQALATLRQGTGE